MEYTYSQLFQNVSEHLTDSDIRDQYTIALDGIGKNDENVEEAQETCRTAIQNYIAKTKGIPTKFLNEKTVTELFNDIIMYGPITSLIMTGAKEGISEIKVYGQNDVCIQQHGRWVRLDNIAFRSFKDLERVKTKILTFSNIGMNEMNGFTDKGILPNGSRVTLAEAPNVGANCYFTIRLYDENLFSHEQLVAIGSITPLQDKLIKFLMKAQANSAWLGPMTSGKTTTLGSYLPTLPKHWHILTIEDIPEFLLKKRSPKSIVTEIYVNEGEFALTWEKAAAFTLRTAATVIFWGEVRHHEAAFRAIENMLSGHRGSGLTGHAGSAEEGIQKSASFYQQALPSMGTEYALQQVSEALDFIPMMRFSPMGKRFMGDISAATWDKKAKEPLIVPMISRRLDKNENTIETYHGIPEFLKKKLLAWNSVFEEDFKEWEI